MLQIISKNRCRLCNARMHIAKSIGNISAISYIYHTAAWGKTDQPDFMNQVVKVASNIEPEGVLQGILAIEKKLGRERIEKWAARTIDIDILFYDLMIINHHNLIIPHPFLQERAFALAPLAELAPNLEHPILKQTISTLLANLASDLAVRKLAN
ncbi:MAG: 2-amino-4-hydroxy-6-hydroxymethyldihydropteridine diphosphokinase [Sphingobacteriales bacterium]|nr:2-amino-4-hydroxy-6-hydroxymethyldihydropteridine diphosphokinase [Sphingobacteriales bacterium]